MGQDIGDIKRSKIRDMISLISGFGKMDWKMFNKALSERLETFGKGKRNYGFTQGWKSEEMR